MAEDSGARGFLGFDEVTLEDVDQNVAPARLQGALPELDYCADAYETMTGADALVLITEWNAFRGLDLDRVKALLRQPVVIESMTVVSGK